eukprot:775475-Amorphochlora_amoeboformis.AAC.1
MFREGSWVSTSTTECPLVDVNILQKIFHHRHVSTFCSRLQRPVTCVKLILSSDSVLVAWHATWPSYESWPLSTCTCSLYESCSIYTCTCSLHESWPLFKYTCSYTSHGFSKCACSLYESCPLYTCTCSLYETWSLYTCTCSFISHTPSMPYIQMINVWYRMHGFEHNIVYHGDQLLRHSPWPPPDTWQSLCAHGCKQLGG